ncbi:MAG: prepilin peptidase [Candidatus Thorarchaeota archaeon]|nr:MAG: prepilin peptidase [Candidatus Thorarchaeota archaeon]
MTLDLSVTSLLVFSLTFALLIVYSAMDLRSRLVRNEYLAIGGLLGFSLVVLSGHLTANSMLHLTAVIFVASVSYLLFRIGAIGGADAKALLIVAILSPGIQLAVWDSPILEALIGGGLELFIMLLLGYAYTRWLSSLRSNSHAEYRTVPLIPFLLLGYILIQILSFL